MSLAWCRVSVICLVGGLMLVMPTSRALALTYLVGAGAVPDVCDFNSLQLAINAAAANPGPDAIRVSRESTFTNAALTIGQQDLIISGGYASCAAALPPDALPTGNTVLDGAGGAAAPVLAITGSGVRDLRNLGITRGDPSVIDGSGGGISFDGRGELVLGNVTVSQNQAAFGGGINFRGNGGPALLTFNENTIVFLNTASVSGGGVRMEGSARLLMTAAQTSIQSNTALGAIGGGFGGGLQVLAPARADIGSPGFGINGAIFNNEAELGGGIAVISDADEQDAIVRIFSRAADRPVRIHENRAARLGGAIYGLPSNQFNLTNDGRSTTCATGVLLESNRAQNGAALYLDTEDNILDSPAGAAAYIGRIGEVHRACDDPSVPTVGALGAVACTSESAGCNVIKGNRSQTLAGAATTGATILVQSGGFLIAEAFAMRGNAAGDLVRNVGGQGRFALCLLAGNVLSGNVIVSESVSDGGSAIRFDQCTLTDNVIGASHVLRETSISGVIELRRTVIWQPGKLSLSFPGSLINNPRLTIDKILVSDRSTLPDGPFYVDGSARFNDPVLGDYRLRLGSGGIDAAPAQTTAPPFAYFNFTRDLENLPREVDLGDVSTNIRIRDLGPHERQASDPWLLNDEFAIDLRLWTNPNPAHSTWEPTGAPSGAGGALLFNVPVEQVGPTERRLALSQCFNVPSAGTYEISGAALTPGNSAQTRDFPVIHWRVRYGAGDCSGPVETSGDAFFLRNNLTWQPLAARLLVPIDPALWTWNTTIEIRLEVAQNTGSPTATGLTARFDSIRIGKQSSLAFADGFESPPTAAD